MHFDIIYCCLISLLLTTLTTLITVCRAERERARVQQQSTSNKLFIFEGTDESGHPVYNPAPQVQQVCQVVDGFIYVTNAESRRGKIKQTFFLFLLFLVLSSLTKILHMKPCLQWVAGSLRVLTFGLCCVPEEDHRLGLC